MPVNEDAAYVVPDRELIQFPSRRSVVHTTDGIIACTQPLAARAGLRILAQGGNAAVSSQKEDIKKQILNSRVGCCSGRWNAP